MVALAGRVFLPLRWVTTFGVLMIASHNLFDYVEPESWGSLGWLWKILHSGGIIVPAEGYRFAAGYPLIPWIGVMAAGYAFGSLYQKDAVERRRLLIRIGGFATALFIIMRATNIYGDPSEWSRQKSLIFSVLSFLNTQKYPPSLLFLLMTLGPGILALAWFESNNKTPGAKASHPSGLRNALVTFGRVPLFFYLLQWPTSHGISVLLHLAFGKPVRWLFQTPLAWNNAPPGTGFSLGVVYLSWIAGVLLLYPLCKWFAGVKQRRREWWLSYL